MADAKVGGKNAQTQGRNQGADCRRLVGETCPAAAPSATTLTGLGGI
jgi:hypothetical protein